MAGVLAALAGVALGWPELATPGGAVVGAFGAGAAGCVGKPKLRVELAPTRRRVPVGGDAGVAVTVSNLGPRRIGPRWLALPVGGQTAMVKAPGLAAGGTAAIRLPVPTGRRSVLTLGPALARQGDPLGLVTRVLSWGEPLELAVYPATVKAPLAGAGSVKDIEGRPAGRPSEADATFHALRDYQAGDDRRAIHWQSTARLGRLVVRQSEETRRLHLALVVSTAADEYASPGDFELAASVYASLGLSQLDSAGQLALVAQGGVLKLARGGRGPLLDQAAAAGLRRQPAGRGGLAAAAKLARLRLPATTLAVMVTGTVLGERQLRRVAALLPRQAAALAIRCRLGAALSVCHLGRLGLVTIGALDQLPQALKSAAAGRAGPGAAPPARAAQAVGQADPVRPSHPGQPGYPGQPAGLAAARAARPMEPP